MMKHSDWMEAEIKKQMNSSMMSALSHTGINNNQTSFNKESLLQVEARAKGAPLGPLPTEYVVVASSRVQVRKHRKRRINKKWAKKYGYKNLCPLKFGECVVIGDKMYMSQETFDVVRKSIPKGCSIHYKNAGGQIRYGK